MTSPPSNTGWPSEEDVARIIHPWAFDGQEAWSEAHKVQCREDALTKARSILSLFPLPVGGWREDQGSSGGRVQAAPDGATEAQHSAGWRCPDCCGLLPDCPCSRAEAALWREHDARIAFPSAPATDTPKSPDLQRVVEALREIEDLGVGVTHLVAVEMAKIASQLLSSLPSGEGEQEVSSS